MGLTSKPDPSVPEKCHPDLWTINNNENNSEICKKITCSHHIVIISLQNPLFREEIRKGPLWGFWNKRTYELNFVFIHYFTIPYARGNSFSRFTIFFGIIQEAVLGIVKLLRENTHSGDGIDNFVIQRC